MKPRALMIIHNFRPGKVGGAELQAERLSTRLAKMGHAMQIVTWLTVPDVPHRLPYWVTGDNARTFRYLVQNRGSYDILHSHMAFGHAVVAVVVARCFRKKSIVKIACTGQYGDLNIFSKFDKFGQALRILHQADAVVALSSEIEVELLRYGFPKERIARIPNGVDATYFRRTQPFPDGGKMRFVLVGRRHPQKGIDILLQAARRLKDRDLGARFEVNLFGPDYPEHDYRVLAKEMSVADVVRFFPFENDMLSVYHASHSLLLPSRGEGLSNSLLEAMAMELAPIATSVSGNPDVIEDGKCGFLIPPDSPDALADAMSRIISDPDGTRILGKNARSKVVASFSLESVALRYSELYEQLFRPEASMRTRQWGQ
jgi:glycosyltransferase involved in cell wall biosynthesis